VTNQKKETPLQVLYDTVSEQLDAGVSGEVMMHDMCVRVDELLLQLWQEKAPHASKFVDLVAVGGYGRGELAPQSDWDIWFLVGDDMDEVCRQELELFLYALWDLGAKIGHAVRSVKETLAHVKEDWNSATAALEARLIYGESQHFEMMQDKLAGFFKSKRKLFVEAKLLELEYG